MTTQSPATDVQNTFREAVNYNSNSQPIHHSHFKGLFDKVTQWTFFWAILTWLVIFLFLYLVNPPFVQKSDNDMTKPTPNLTTIIVISSCCACGVILATKFNLLSTSSAFG